MHRRFDLCPGDIISNIAHDESFCPRAWKMAAFQARGGSERNFPPAKREGNERNRYAIPSKLTRLYSLYCFPITILYHRYYIRRLVLPSSGNSPAISTCENWSESWICCARWRYAFRLVARAIARYLVKNVTLDSRKSKVSLNKMDIVTSGRCEYLTLEPKCPRYRIEMKFSRSRRERFYLRMFYILRFTLRNCTKSCLSDSV